MPRYDEFVERIKNGPHWRLLIQPQPYVQGRLPLEELLPTIGRATVRFRGWDFPHLDRNGRPAMGSNYVAAGNDFMGHLEYWRMYMSGQFLYLSGVRESTEPGWKDKLVRTARFRILVGEDFDWTKVPGFFEVVNFIYVVTEFFEFASRVSQGLPQMESAKLTIGLHNIEGYVLTVDDFRRELHGYYAADESTLENSWDIRLSDLVGSSGDLVLEAIRWFFVRFGWTQPNMEAIKRDIQDLTQRGS